MGILSETEKIRTTRRRKDMKKYLSLMLAVLMLLSLAVPAYADEPATAQGQGNGIDGPVVVEVKADANTIYEVNVLQQNETPGIGSVAVEKLPGAMVAANTIEVDGITGATVTTTAIKAAVTEALTAMGFDPASYAGAAAPAEAAAPADSAANAPA
jgi:fumarate reductase flavoprotein subunit